MAEEKKGTVEAEAETLEVMKLVNENDLKGVLTMLQKGEATVHDTDSTGMTPLMHAAYKGNAKMCEMLIKQGSDVNADAHSHNYTPLHFAALSSNLDTVQLLLENGAKTYKKNTLSRTAAEMAGFVGHSACVAIINTFMDKKELQRFTTTSSDSQDAMIKPKVAEELYRLISGVNLSPVSLTVSVGRSVNLMEHLSAASKVLHSLSVAETKKHSNVNEMLSLKLHYLSHLLQYLEKELTKYQEKEKTDNKETESVPEFESFLKQLLKCRASDGAEVWQELWIRDAIKSFHCIEMPLFLDVGRNISGQEVQSLSVLTQAINGRRGFADENACTACCNSHQHNKHCSKCKAVRYCTRYCQRLHWTSHKKFCESLAKQSAKAN